MGDFCRRGSPAVEETWDLMLHLLSSVNVLSCFASSPFDSWHCGSDEKGKSRSEKKQLTRRERDDKMTTEDLRSYFTLCSLYTEFWTSCDKNRGFRWSDSIFGLNWFSRCTCCWFYVVRSERLLSSATQALLHGWRRGQLRPSPKLVALLLIPAS